MTLLTERTWLRGVCRVSWSLLNRPCSSSVLVPGSAIQTPIAGLNGAVSKHGLSDKARTA